MAFFLTRPKLTVFGIVSEAMDTHMVQFLGFWYRQRGRKWAFLASLKKRLRALHAAGPPVRLFTCPPVHLSTCPPVHLSACPPVHLSACPPAEGYYAF